MGKLGLGAVAVAATLLLIYLFMPQGSTTGARPPGPASPSPYGCTVEGLVLDGTGVPVPGAVVVARRTGPGPVYRDRSLPAGEDGRFSLVVSPAHGRYAFRVERPDGSSFAPAAEVVAVPGGRREVTLRSPPAGAPPEAPAAPNLGGSVSDASGQALQEMEVVAVDAKGRVLARARTGPDGRFALHVDAKPRFRLRLAHVPKGARCEPAEVVALGVFNYWLIVQAPPPGEGELLVDVRPTVPLPTAEPPAAWFRILNHRGEEQRNVRLPLRSETYHFPRIPYGVYDLYVKAGDYSGVVQGFEFSARNPGVEVAVGPAASVRARFDRPARAMLLSRSPTFVPMSLEYRQSEARLGSNRARVAASRAPTTEIEFRGLSPGRYRLRIGGDDLETVFRDIDLRSGQALDLGTIEIAPATARLTLTLFDREHDRTDLRFPYDVLLYDLVGHRWRHRVAAGRPKPLRFDRVPAGTYYLSVRRVLDRPEHTRSFGDDLVLPIEAGEDKHLELDETWRIE